MKVLLKNGKTFDLFYNDKHVTMIIHRKHVYEVDKQVITAIQPKHIIKSLRLRRRSNKWKSLITV